MYSYSQQLEDIYIYLDFLLRGIDINPVIVEVGAFDGITLSNSKFFEQYCHFRSYLLEASPENYIRLVKNRPQAKCFNFAASDKNSVEYFLSGYAVGGLSSSMPQDHYNRYSHILSNKKQVQTRRLDGFFHEQNIERIGILSIDCEGADFQVIQGIDYARVNIDIIIVEQHADSPDQITSLLAGEGFILHTRLYGNQVWLSKQIYSKYHVQRSFKLSQKISFIPLYLESSCINSSRKLLCQLGEFLHLYS